MKHLNKWTLLIYYFAIILFSEILLRTKTLEFEATVLSILIPLLFSCVAAGIMFFVSTLLKPAGNYIITIILTFCLGFIFASQYSYHTLFKIFYTIYTASRATDALEFWREGASVVLDNLLWVLLFFAPLVLLILGKKFINFNPIKWPIRSILCCFIILCHGLGLTLVHAGDRGVSSAYNLYYNRSYHIQSVNRLGMLTTMRLDLQRLVTGWSPTNQPPPADQPAWNPKPPEVDPVEYNALDIDFRALAEAESDEAIADMHRYFASLKPSEKNDYTGKYQGYNLILITAEAFSHLAIREDVTPTLYKMLNEGYQFTNFYTAFWEVSTSDGEYVACTGLLPKSGVWSFAESANNYMPFAMGNQLQQLGYSTHAYHNHTHTYYRRHLSHPNLGYVYKGIGNGLEMRNTWPRSDLEMMQITIPEYIDNQPFHAYYMTVSGHLQYNFFGNFIARKNRQLVADLPLSTAARAYLATQIELDRALEHLLNQLEEAGVAENTLIAISSDHYPYGLDSEEIDELTGHKVDRHLEIYRNSFLIYAKGMEPVTIHEPTSSLDIIPTLSNLLGLEFDSRLLMGRDVHSNAEPLVLFADGSFITNKGRFNANTGRFYFASGESVDDGYVESISAKIARKVYYSAAILDTDYYGKLFLD